MRLHLADPAPDSPVLLLPGAGLRPQNPVFQIYSNSPHVCGIRRRSIVHSQGDGVLLHGDSFSHGARGANPALYYAGVVSPSDSAVSLCPAAVVSVRRYVTAAAPLADRGSTAASSTAVTTSSADGWSSPCNAFGSRRTKLYARYRDLPRSAAAAESKAAAGGLVLFAIQQASSSFSSVAPPDVEEHVLAVYPPMNASAQCLGSMYTLQSLMGQTYAALMQVAELFFSVSKSRRTLAESMARYLGRALPADGERLILESVTAVRPERRRVILLLFAHFLARLASTDGRSLRTSESLARALETTNDVARALVAHFYQSYPGRRQKITFGFTKASRERVLAHLVATRLLLNSYSFNVEELAKELRISQAKLADIACDLGCTIKKRTVHDGEGDASYHAVLTLLSQKQ